MNILQWIRDAFHLDPLFIGVPVAAIVLLTAYLALFYAVKMLCRLSARPDGKESGNLENTTTGFLRGFLLVPLLLLAMLAAGNYLDDFGKWRYGSFFNAYEFYHYYMGSKYANEIGYYNLYSASLVADEETGGDKGRMFKGTKKGGKLRNLENGTYESIELVLARKDEIKARFSEARWQEWLKDIQWFKKQLVASRWEGVLCDKGYNGTPIWSSLVGGILSNHISTDNEMGMNFLASLDLILILATALCVGWAFGPRAALLMIIVLGTAYMSKFSHMKGAYLRTDFTMSLVLAACMIKKNRYGLAGLFTAWAVCARVFPAVFLFGLGAKLFWELLRIAGTVWDRARALLGGAGAALLLAAVCAAGAFTGAVAAWVLHVPLETKFGLPAVYWPKLALLIAPLGAAGALLAVSGLWGLVSGLLERRYIHYFAAFAATVLVLFSVSVYYSSGLSLWKEYSAKIGHHNQDISPWRVGLKYAFIARFDKPFHWEQFKDETVALAKKTLTGEEEKGGFPKFQRDARKTFDRLKVHTVSTFYAKSPLLWWTLHVFMLLFALFAVRGLSDSMAFVFGFVPCFFLVSPTYYYYVMILVPLLFFTAEMDRPSRVLGLFWILAMGMLGYSFYGMWQQGASTYQWCSFLGLAMVFYMMLLAVFERRWWFHGLMMALATVVVVAYLSRWYLHYVAIGYPGRLSMSSEPIDLGHVAAVFAGYAFVLIWLEWIAYSARLTPPAIVRCATEPAGMTNGSLLGPDAVSEGGFAAEACEQSEASRPED